MARNYGITKSRGLFIAFLDADDIWVRNKLADQIKVFESHPDVDFLYSMNQLFGDVSIFSNKYGVLPLPFRAALTYDQLKQGNSICTSTVMMKKSILDRSGLFSTDPILKIGEDYELWLRLAKHSKIHFLSKIHTLYRISASNTSGDLKNHCNSLRYIYEKYGIENSLRRYPKRRSAFAYLVRNVIHTVYMKRLKV